MNDNLEMASEDDYYEVEKIVDKRKFKGKMQYFVKWKNYPSSTNTWEPMSHLKNVNDLVEEYENELKGKDEREQEEEKKEKEKKKKEKNGTPPCKWSEETEKKKTKTQIPKKRKMGDYEDLGFGEEPEIIKKKKVEKKIPEKLLGSPEIPLMVSESLEGEFETDQPQEVKSIKKIGKDLICTLEWKARADGFIPKPSEFSNKKVKTECPSLLFDFYESRLKFPNSSAKNTPPNTSIQKNIHNYK